MQPNMCEITTRRVLNLDIFQKFRFVCGLYMAIPQKCSNFIHRDGLFQHVTLESSKYGTCGVSNVSVLNAGAYVAALGLDGTACRGASLQVPESVKRHLRFVWNCGSFMGTQTRANKNKALLYNLSGSFM
jgi:hypothetical protein